MTILENDFFLFPNWQAFTPPLSQTLPRKFLSPATIEKKKKTSIVLIEDGDVAF